MKPYQKLLVVSEVMRMFEKIPAEILSAVFIAFGTLLSGLTTWLVKVIVDVYTAKTEKEKGDKALDELTRYLEIAGEAINHAVATVLVEYVEKIKGTEDWTEEAQKNAELLALIKSEDQLGPDVINKIIEFINPDGIMVKTFSDWAQPRIAAALEKAKTEVAIRKALEKGK